MVGFRNVTLRTSPTNKHQEPEPVVSWCAVEAATEPIRLLRRDDAPESKLLSLRTHRTIVNPSSTQLKVVQWKLHAMRLPGCRKDKADTEGHMQPNNCLQSPWSCPPNE
ncbi:hypothetical protein CEXT_810821 [Caerostris extrusa]|uniref:Uncharacterized protein n=1 Tax=Caerostris extrusa TaxID=172846 RepID=A0AAV4XIJ9_CAEEX|nr:hypothetical protein CEXT_810821 [Caerostris extrusa]